MMYKEKEITLNVTDCDGRYRTAVEAQPLCTIPQPHKHVIRSSSSRAVIGYTVSMVSSVVGSRHFNIPLGRHWEGRWLSHTLFPLSTVQTLTYYNSTSNITPSSVSYIASVLSLVIS